MAPGTGPGIGLMIGTSRLISDGADDLEACPSVIALTGLVAAV